MSLNHAKIYNSVLHDWSIEYFQMLYGNQYQPIQLQQYEDKDKEEDDDEEKDKDKEEEYDHWQIINSTQITGDHVRLYPHLPWKLTESNIWILTPILNKKRAVLREEYLQTHLAKKRAEMFIKSDLKRELMEKLWHPRNMEKWSEVE
jgi:hypothetical protein